MVCVLSSKGHYAAVWAQQCLRLDLPHAVANGSAVITEESVLTPLCSNHETNEAESADLQFPEGQQFHLGTWPFCGDEMWYCFSIGSDPISEVRPLPTSCNWTQW